MRALSMVALLMLPVACGSEQPPSSGPQAPPATQGEPAGAATGPFFVDEASIRIAESFPIQVFLDVSGNQPTPCDEAAWTVERVAGTVQVEVFTVVDPAATCVAVLEPVDLVIPLGDFESGTWQVLLNGEEVAGFEA